MSRYKIHHKGGQEQRNQEIIEQIKAQSQKQDLVRQTREEVTNALHQSKLESLLKSDLYCLSEPKSNDWAIRSLLWLKENNRNCLTPLAERIIDGKLKRIAMGFPVRGYQFSEFRRRPKPAPPEVLLNLPKKPPIRK